MDQFIIKGGLPLQGDVSISGNKNLATPLIASALLFAAPVTFHNVPDIEDVRVMIRLLASMGAKTEFSHNTLTLDTRSVDPSKIDQQLVAKVRSSVLLIGPLLARFNYVKISQPGGCKIGARPLTTHLNGFRDLGVTVNETSEFIELKNEKPLSKKQYTVFLDEFSVTATENLLLFFALQKAQLTIHLAAAEPHIQELCRFLSLAGATIVQTFPHTIAITGTKKITTPKDFVVDADFAETGLFLIMGALSKGAITIHKANMEYFAVILSKFKRIGVNVEIIDRETMKVNYSPNLKALKIQTLPYPGFPTELQPQMGVLATQMQGISSIHEVLFEGRLKYLEELNKMGAQSIILDPHRAVIIGPTPLYGREIASLDIRSGIAFVTAALIAQGETIINDIYQIDRGYERIDEKLQGLGANIQRVTKK